MKTCFVHPPQELIVEPGVYPPLGIGYLCAVIRRDFPSIQCDSLNLDGYTRENAIATVSQYDVIGYTVASPFWHVVKDIADRVKTAHPEKIQIIGGPHVSLTNDTSWSIDARFIGPSTKTISEYIGALVRGETPKKEYVGIEEPLDSIPYPIVDAGKRLNYMGPERVAVLMSSRGCSDKCAFCCCRGLYKKIKFRSVDNVVGEMDQWASRGINEFRFMDDAFTMSRKRTLEFCRAVKPRAMKWAAMSRVNQVDPELLAEMKSAGCVELAYGIESFDDNVLKTLHKMATPEQNVAAIEQTFAAGINVHVLLMVSTPGETYKTTIQKNIDALEALKGKYVKVLFSTFMPHPGCDIYDHPERYHITIEDKDYSKYMQHQYCRMNGVVQMWPAWSPIRIEGMTYEQQLENITSLREYVLSVNRLTPYKG